MKKVMFVDDEALLALASEATLMAEGYDVAIAFDGEEALAKATTFRPDIVVTDLMMPGMDGVGLARALTDQRIVVPVVLITAVPEVELSAEVRALFAGYLGKPLRDEEMVACISALLRA